MTTINLLKHDDVSIALFAMVSRQLPYSSPEWQKLGATRDPGTPGVVEIVLTLNGVVIPDPVEALTAIINRELGRLNELASQRALEMVSEAGLNGVREAHDKLVRDIESARFELRRALRDKAGCEFNDD